MVMAFKITVERDATRDRNHMPRGCKKLIKETMKEGMAEWHTRYMGHHFTRAAYSRYGWQGAYPHRKRSGDPYVESGRLRERMTRRRTAAEVTGTSKRVTLRLKFGRPPKYTEERLRKMIAREMRKGATYKQAQRRVYRQANYSRQMREQAQRDLAVVAGGEMRSLRILMRKKLGKKLSARGGKLVTRIRY